MLNSLRHDRKNWKSRSKTAKSFGNRSTKPIYADFVNRRHNSVLPVEIEQKPEFVSNGEVLVLLSMFGVN